MEPSTRTATETAGSEAAGVRPPRRDSTTMIDSVKVDQATFDSVIFLGSEERKEYVEGDAGKRIPHNEKKQQYSKDGVPVWTLKLYVTTWRGLERQVKVNVAAADDPGERFAKGELVTLSDIEFGVTPKREGNGFVIWMKAGAIESADSSAVRRPAVSSVA